MKVRGLQDPLYQTPSRDTLIYPHFGVRLLPSRVLGGQDFLSS